MPSSDQREVMIKVGPPVKVPADIGGVNDENPGKIVEMEEYEDEIL